MSLCGYFDTNATPIVGDDESGIIMGAPFGSGSPDENSTIPLITSQEDKEGKATPDSPIPLAGTSNQAQTREQEEMERQATEASVNRNMGIGRMLQENRELEQRLQQQQAQLDLREHQLRQAEKLAEQKARDDASDAATKRTVELGKKKGQKLQEQREAEQRVEQQTQLALREQEALEAERNAALREQEALEAEQVARKTASDVLAMQEVMMLESEGMADQSRELDEKAQKHQAFLIEAAKVTLEVLNDQDKLSSDRAEWEERKRLRDQSCERRERELAKAKLELEAEQEKVATDLAKAKSILQAQEKEFRQAADHAQQEKERLDKEERATLEAIRLSIAEQQRQMDELIQAQRLSREDLDKEKRALAEAQLQEQKRLEEVEQDLKQSQAQAQARLEEEKRIFIQQLEADKEALERKAEADWQAQRRESEQLTRDRQALQSEREAKERYDRECLASQAATAQPTNLANGPRDGLSQVEYATMPYLHLGGWSLELVRYNMTPEDRQQLCVESWDEFIRRHEPLVVAWQNAYRVLRTMAREEHRLAQVSRRAEEQADTEEGLRGLIQWRYDLNSSEGLACQSAIKSIENLKDEDEESWRALVHPEQMSGLRHHEQNRQDAVLGLGVLERLISRHLRRAMQERLVVLDRESTMATPEWGSILGGLADRPDVRDTFIRVALSPLHYWRAEMNQAMSRAWGEVNRLVLETEQIVNEIQERRVTATTSRETMMVRMVGDEARGFVRMIAFAAGGPLGPGLINHPERRDHELQLHSQEDDQVQDPRHPNDRILPPEVAASIPRPPQYPEPTSFLSRFNNLEDYPGDPVGGQTIKRSQQENALKEKERREQQAIAQSLKLEADLEQARREAKLANDALREQEEQLAIMRKEVEDAKAKLAQHGSRKRPFDDESEEGREEHGSITGERSVRSSHTTSNRSSRHASRPTSPPAKRNVSDADNQDRGEGIRARKSRQESLWNRVGGDRSEILNEPEGRGKDRSRERMESLELERREYQAQRSRRSEGQDRSRERSDMTITDKGDGQREHHDGRRASEGWDGPAIKRGGRSVESDDRSKDQWGNPPSAEAILHRNSIRKEEEEDERLNPKRQIAGWCKHTDCRDANGGKGVPMEGDSILCKARFKWSQVDLKYHYTHFCAHKGGQKLDRGVVLCNEVITGQNFGPLMNTIVLREERNKPGSTIGIPGFGAWLCFRHRCLMCYGREGRYVEKERRSQKAGRGVATLCTECRRSLLTDCRNPSNHEVLLRDWVVNQAESDPLALWRQYKGCDNDKTEPITVSWKLGGSIDEYPDIDPSKTYYPKREDIQLLRCTCKSTGGGTQGNQ